MLIFKKVLLSLGILLILYNPIYAEDNQSVSTRQTGSTETFAPATAIKNYYVDPYTGSANFTIPISLPPARKNLPLKLNLVYSSRAGNGWLGVGWKLDLGVIERSTKDGYPKYDSTDKFVFSLGQQQNDLVNIGSQEYRPKTADIAWKFIFDGQRWQVKDNLGNTYYFGLDNYLNDFSRTKDPKNSGKIFRWRLSKITDTSGNNIIFKYLSDKIEIYYTEKTEAVKNSYKKEDYNYLVEINFSSDRQDELSNCRAGFNDNYPLAGKARINEIKILYRNQLARRYALEYIYSPVTSRSLLEEITEYGSDNIKKNSPIKFNYSAQEVLYNSIVVHDTPAGDNLWTVLFASDLKKPADYNHIDCLTPEGFHYYGSPVKPSIPVKWSEAYTEANKEVRGFSWSIESNGNIIINGKKGQAFYISTYVEPFEGPISYQIITFSFRGNSNPRVIPGYSCNTGRCGCPSNQISLWKDRFNRIIITGYNFDSDFTFYLNLDIAKKVKKMNSQLPVIPQLSGDFNGDGLTDLGTFYKKDGKCEISLSDKGGFLPSQIWITNFGKDEDILLGDFNGDGKTDLLTFNPSRGDWRLAISDGTKFIDKGVVLGGFGRDLPISLGDFNGDGLTDIGVFSVSISKLYFQAAFGNGNGFNKQSSFILKELDNLYNIDIPYTGDFNGDGITDFVFNKEAEIGKDKIEIKGYNNLWSQASEEIDEIPYYLATRFITDYDSDGRSDICVYHDIHGTKQAISGINNMDNIKLNDLKVIYLIEDSSLNESPGQIQSGDFNGDGLTDFVAYNSVGAMELILSESNNQPDLLISVENGWGGILEFYYKSSSFYENSWGLPFSIPVISKVMLSDGLGNSYQTEYTYSKGYYDTVSDEFRGFGYASSVDNEGNMTETRFLQDDIYKGKILQQDISDKDANVFAEVKNTWTNTSPYPGTYIVSLSETNEYAYDGDPTFKQKKTTFQYDSYGNQAKMKEWGDISVTQDERESITEYTYDTGSWLISYPSHSYIQDTAGKKIKERWFYYNKGLLAREEDLILNPIAGSSNTAIIQYSYDGFGNVIKITDPLGRATATEYDTDLHTYPSKVTNASGHIAKYTYDLKTGQVLTSSDPNNQTTRNIYDALGRLTKVIGPDDTDDNPAITYQYTIPDSTTNLLFNNSFELWDGNETKPLGWNKPQCNNPNYSFNLKKNNQEKIKGSYGLSIGFRGCCYIYWCGSAIVYSDYSDYDALRGKPIIFNCWVKTDEEDGVKLSIEDGVNTSSSLPHSGSGDWELLTVKHKLPDHPQRLRLNLEIKDEDVKAYFDAAGLYKSNEPIRITRQMKTSYATGLPSHRTTYFFYDGLGRLIQTKTDAEVSPSTGRRRRVVSDIVKYDHRGNVKEKYLPYFTDASDGYNTDYADKPKFTFEYDCLGRLTQTTNPDGTSSQNLYSDWTTTFIDENGHKTKQTQDAYGRVIKVEEYNSTQIYSTSYKYDALDNLIKITDSKNNSTYFTYDSLGRRLKVNDPDMGIWNYEYDTVGNLTKQIDARGQILEFTYDALNRIKTKKTGGRTLASYTYDDTSKQYCIGRLSKITDTSGSQDYSYDKLSRQIKTTKTINGQSLSIEQTYDALDRVVTLKYPDGEILTYTYNKAGQIEKVTQGSTQIVKNVDYSPTQQITKIEYGNNTATDYAYDPYTLRLTNILTQAPTKKIQDLNYSFDNVGNITNIQDYANTSTQSFLYDDLNRLIRAQGTYGSFNYTYDSIGNITHKKGINYTYNRNKPHAVRSTSDGTTFEYDSNGNLILKSKAGLSQRFTYDLENRLVKVEENQDPQIKTISIYLQPGVNYISLPFGPSFKIKEILASIQTSRQEVAYWDATQNKYLYNVNDPDFDQFDTLEYGKGYWIYITNPSGVTLTLTGRMPDTQQITLKSGWNSIGSPKDTELGVEEALNPLQLGTDYASVWRYASKDAPWYQQYSQTKKEFTKLKAGEGYWMKMLRDATWNINNATFTTSLAEFVYDSNGSRVKKVSGGKTTLYIESLYEKDSDARVRKHIFLGTNRICTKVSSGETYYYHSDHLGSSNVITDQSGNQIQLDEYTPFGTLAKQNPSASVTNYLFNGKELDNSTGLYYYGARYYNPNIGKFIQPDPIIQDVFDPQNLNHYAYCRNNPLILTDPSGLSYWNDPFSSSYSSYSSYSHSTYSSYGGYSSYSSSGSSWNNDIYSSWSYQSLNSLFNNYSTSWGYNQIGNTFSNWSFTSNSLNSFTTSSMMSFSSGLGYQSASSIWQDYRSSSGLGSGLNNFGSSLMGGISNPFGQSSISSIAKGAGAYFGLQASTFPENSYGQLSNIGFQSGFQGAGILQGSFGGNYGYYGIYDRFMSGSISSTLQAYTAIGIHAIGVGLKAVGTQLGRYIGATYLGGPTFGVGTILGGVGGTIIGGTVTSYLVDRAEEYIFRRMGIR